MIILRGFYLSQVTVDKAVKCVSENVYRVCDSSVLSIPDVEILKNPDKDKVFFAAGKAKRWRDIFVQPTYSLSTRLVSLFEVQDYT